MISPAMAHHHPIPLRLSTRVVAVSFSLNMPALTCNEFNIIKKRWEIKRTVILAWQVGMLSPGSIPLGCGDQDLSGSRCQPPFHEAPAQSATDRLAATNVQV